MNVPHHSLQLDFDCIGDYAIPINGHIPEEMDKAIEIVRTLLKSMESTRSMYQRGATNDTLVRMWLEGMMADKELSEYIPHQSRTRACLYFLKHPCVDGVKVGYTTDLPTRIQGLESAIQRRAKGIPVRNISYRRGYQSLLFIGCDHGKRSVLKLEETVHYVLASDRISGEWFRTDAVAAWLGSFYPKQLDMILSLAEAQS